MSKLGLVVLDNNNKNKIQIDTHPSVKSNEQVRLGRFRQQQKNKNSNWYTPLSEVKQASKAWSF